MIAPYLEDATPIDIAALLADLLGEFQPPPGLGAQVVVSGVGRKLGFLEDDYARASQPSHQDQACGDVPSDIEPQDVKVPQFHACPA